MKSINRGPWAPILGTKPQVFPQTTGNLIAPSPETTHQLAEFSKSARLTSSRNEKTPRVIVVHMKEKFCKGNIFIPPFLTGPDMRYKRGHYGILPKKCHVAPSPLDKLTTPFVTRGIAHYTRTGDVSPSPGIIQPAPSTGWERRAIQLPRSDISGSSNSACPESIRSRQFRFPGQLGSSDTRNSPDPFPPTIKKQTLIILTTKSPFCTVQRNFS